MIAWTGLVWPAPQFLGEVVGNDEPHLGLAVLEERVDAAGRIRRGDLLEIVGAGERRQESAAFLRAVVIDDGQGDVLDVDGRRVAEQDELDDRRQEQGADHPLVAKDLYEFLADDVVDDSEHFYSLSKRSFKRNKQTAKTNAAKPVKAASSGQIMPKP